MNQIFIAIFFSLVYLETDQFAEDIAEIDFSFASASSQSYNIKVTYIECDSQTRFV